MEVSTQQLIEMVVDQAPTRDPLVMLETAVRVAGQVGGMADAMVDHYVGASRAAGLSWTEIAERLGVSKQAAAAVLVTSGGYGGHRRTASSGSPVGGEPPRCS